MLAVRLNVDLLAEDIRRFEDTERTRAYTRANSKSKEEIRRMRTPRDTKLIYIKFNEELNFLCSHTVKED